MLAANVWAFVVLAVLIAPVALSSGSLEDGEYSSNLKPDARPVFDIHPRESSRQTSKRSTYKYLERFTKKYFLANGKEILDNVIKQSKLIEGMSTGELDPDHFSRFELQDGRYLTEGRDVLENTGNILKEKYPGFYEMCFKQASKYEDHRKLLLMKYNLQSFDCVIPHPVNAKYAEFLRNDPRIKEDPRRLLFAILACSHSWRYISGMVLPYVNPKSVYKKKWLEPNFRVYDYESELEMFLNTKYEEKMFTEEEIKILIGLYMDAMKNEGNFILEGGDLVKF